MKIITDQIQDIHLSNFQLEILSEGSCFYDIETTGLMSKRNHIYLIGCAKREGSCITVTQFFSENNQEEVLILQEFLQYISDCTQLISFNGIRFDLPFIMERMGYHGLTQPFPHIPQLDIYQECRKMKPILSLPSYKQKSIEAFLGILREDMYNGGQLIEVYHSYVAHPTAEAEHLLLIHNKEDVTGMLALLPVLTYRQLLSGDFTITDVSCNTFTPFNTTQEAHELIVKLKPDIAFPANVRIKGSQWYAAIKPTEIAFQVLLYEGELKYFFQDYKSYDYLPQEDMAIHKSLSAFMDNRHKTRATKKNCYTRKSGCFLPIPDTFCSNAACFQKEWNDKQRYIEYIPENIPNSLLHDMILAYFQSVI